MTSRSVRPRAVSAPAYEAKVARDGLRLYDLISDDFEGRVEEAIRRRSRELGDAAETERLVAEGLDAARAWRPRMQPFICDTTTMLNEWLEAGEHVLFEGAQGTLLDVDHGTYPYVTSSNTAAGYFSPGSGVSPRTADRVVGVLKAYTTRVGEGPFPSELEGEVGERVRSRGNEYGTTTGRPRRCGWLDLVAARYARRVSGVDSIALTKLDVLDSLDEIPVCTGYRIDGEQVTSVPRRRHRAGEGRARLRDPPRLGNLDRRHRGVRRAAARGTQLRRLHREVGRRLGGPDLDRREARRDRAARPRALPCRASGLKALDRDVGRDYTFGWGR